MDEPSKMFNTEPPSTQNKSLLEKFRVARPALRLTGLFSERQTKVPPKKSSTGSQQFQAAGKSIFRFLGLFKKKHVQVSPDAINPSLTPDEIRWKFRKAKICLRVIHYLNEVSTEIVKYGTSSNLYDLGTRDRPALQRYLFPLHSVNLIESQVVEFPLIHPKSILKGIWNPIIATLIIYTATIMPYQISFLSDNSNIIWDEMEFVIDALFWLDLVVNFISAYQDEDGRLVKTRREVMLNYFKSWFFVDLLSCLPFDYIISSLSSQGGGGAHNIRLVRLARLPRLYRLIRVTKMVKYFGKNNILDGFEFNTGVTRLLTLMITVFMLVHLFGCLWHYIAYLNDYDYDTWVYRNHLTHASNFTKYIASIYYAFTALTTVGYGDIHAKTAIEMIVTIFWMVVGVGFYSYTIGLMASVLANIDYKAWKLQKKTAIMNEFCNEKNISKSLKEKLKQAIDYNFLKNPFIWADKTTIFKDLPINLRYEMMMLINGGIFSNIQLFRSCEDKALVVKMIPLLKPMLIQAGEVLWQSDSYPDARLVYFLSEGRVNFMKEFLIDEQSQKSTVLGFKSMISGSYFGETEILFCMQREYTVVCEQECEFFYLTRYHFETEFVNDFPHIIINMCRVSKERQLKNQETIKQLRNFIDERVKQRQGFFRSAERERSLIDQRRRDYIAKYIDGAQKESVSPKRKSPKRRSTNHMPESYADRVNDSQRITQIGLLVEEIREMLAGE